MKFKPQKFLVLAIAGLTISSLALTSCNQQSNNYHISSGVDLTKNISTTNANVEYTFTGESTDLPQAYEKYSETVIEFSAELFKNIYNENKNTVVSPITMYKNLALLSNGTLGSTEKEFKDVLGDGVISTTNINHCTDYVTQRLQHYNNDNHYLNLAQSIWIKNDVEVRNGFLQKNANFFEDSIYQVDFNKNSITHDFNDWAEYETNGDVPKIVKDIDKNSSIYLANTLSINSNFINGFNPEDATKGKFTNRNGEKVDTTFFNSTQRVVKTNEAVAFSKGLDTIPATFVAILPNENIDIEYYISDFLGKQLDQILDAGEEPKFVNVSIPSFSITNNDSYKNTLQDMGIEEIFTKDAKFNNLTSSNVKVTDIVQNVEIDFSHNGIKNKNDKSKTNIKINKNTNIDDTILYNRPFIFLVVDNESNVPVILGNVNNK